MVQGLDEYGAGRSWTQKCFGCPGLVPYTCGLISFIFSFVTLILVGLSFTNLKTYVMPVPAIVHTGINWPPYSMLDSNGDISGFNIDLMKEVEKRTGMEFKWIVEDWVLAVDTFEGHGGGNGWRTGELFLSKHADVSVGYAVTQGRTQVFWQGTPWTHDTKGVLFVPTEKKGDDYREFVHKIGILRGWATDLPTAKKYFNPRDGVVSYLSGKEAGEAMNNGTIDAVFVLDDHEDLFADTKYNLAVSETAPPVTLAGFALISYKGLPGSAIAERLDKGVQEVIKDEKFYRGLCDKYKDTEATKGVTCLPKKG